MFNEYFASVGTVGNNVLPPCTNKMCIEKILSNVEFNSDNVMLVMNKLKANLSRGPDGLPPLLFKRLKHYLAGPLAMIYTQLLSVAAVPDGCRSLLQLYSRKAPQALYQITDLYP